MERSFLDGITVCGDCGLPLLSDGQGGMAHIDQLSFKRLRELCRDKDLALLLFDRWLRDLEVTCPDCGEMKKPFLDMTGVEFAKYVATKSGARDFYEMLQSLLGAESNA